MCNLKCPVPDVFRQGGCLPLGAGYREAQTQGNRDRAPCGTGVNCSPFTRSLRVRVNPGGFIHLLHRGDLLSSTPSAVIR